MVLLLVALTFVLTSNKTTSDYEEVLLLNNTCPPGFKLNDKNECIAQNLYMQYNSPNNKGVGGLQTGLPEIRDGFSPQEIEQAYQAKFRGLRLGDNRLRTETAGIVACQLIQSLHYD